MDVSKIIELVNALEDTWFGTVCMGLVSIGLVCTVICFFKSLDSLTSSIAFTRLHFLLTKYVEFSLLRDFPDYVKTEKSAKCLEKVRLWFIRNS